VVSKLAQKQRPTIHRIKTDLIEKCYAHYFAMVPLVLI
jgi:hypothetical protein